MGIVSRIAPDAGGNSAVLRSLVYCGDPHWSLTNFINHKNNQQAQLNSFISIVSDLMISKGLNTPGSKALVPPVSRATHDFIKQKNSACPKG